MAVCVQCFFLIMPSVGLKIVIVAIPGHTQLHYVISSVFFIQFCVISSLVITSLNRDLASRL